MSLSNTHHRALFGALLVSTFCSAGAQEPSAQKPTASPVPDSSAGVPPPQMQAAAPAKTATPAPTTPETASPQSNPPGPVSAPGPASRGREEPTRLDTVVVTATKRAAPVRNIPATINVLSGEQLEREGVQGIEQIVSQVPGVNLTDDGTGGAAKRITIRGISTGYGLNPTVGTLYGDIPFSDPFIPKVQLDPNPFDMATVEVLKGPQGTLFGGTGLNGLIRYVPEAPQLDEFRVKYYAQLNTYPGNGGDGWSYGAVLNAPFADNRAALRLVGFRRDVPGYVDDTQSGKRDVNTGKQHGFRAAVAFEPAEHWNVSLMAAMQKTTEDDIAFTDNDEGRLERGNSPRPSPAESSYTLGTLSIERAFPWGDLISQTSYVEKKFDIFLDASRALGGQQPLLAGVNDNHSESITQEVRLVSAPGDSPWRWLAGAFYYDTRLYDCSDVGAELAFPGLLPAPVLDALGLLPTPCAGNAAKLEGTLALGQLVGDIELKEQALFGEVTRALGERWEATVGARVYRIESSGSVFVAGLLYPTAGPGGTERKRRLSERGISPKASLVFVPTKDLRAYASVSRGFRFGGPQISASTLTTTVPETYKSDSLLNYEVGLRSDWFDRALRVDVSAYHVDWKDPQVFQLDELRVVSFIDNVGGAKANGVEVSLGWRPASIPGLSLDTSMAWNRTVTTASFDAGSGGVVPKGALWPLSPRLQSATTLAYVQPVRDWQVGASLRHMYVDQACNTIECTAQVFGYHTVDLNLFASPGSNSHWPQLSLSLVNLTDKRGYSNVTTNPFPAGDTVAYIAPRMLMLRLSGSF